MAKKILLADDSITIQKVIELTFSDEDFEVVTVGNGRLAIERVQDVRPDLVLCDIIMPEKDGYEVCDFIKKTPGLSHTPVLLLTGAFEPFDQERAARVGCDGFLAKPFEPQTLIAKVKELLSQAATRTVAAPRAAVAAPAAVTVPVAAAPPPPMPVPKAIFDPMGSGSAFPGTTVAAPVSTPARPPAAPPAAPASEATFEEEEPSFISDEPLEEPPTMVTPRYEEFSPRASAPTYDEPPVPPPAPVDELSYVDELPEPDELMDVSPEESDQGDESDTEETSGAAPAPWAGATVEVPLEMRAQAGVESAHPHPHPQHEFDDMFEEERPAAAVRPGAVSSAPSFVPPPAPPPAPAPSRTEDDDAVHDDFGFVRTQDVIGSPAEPSAPSAAAPEAVREGFGWVRQADLPETRPAPPRASDTGAFLRPEPEKRAPEPAEDESFASVTAASAVDPSVARSVAAEIGVPVDMVEKIAQRVVAQISEKVIREIAWEVIPDLAESLIKKEIERLKGELQET